MSALFVVKVSAVEAMCILKSFMETQDKSFHFVIDPSVDDKVRVLLKNGTNPNIPHSQKRWTSDTISLFQATLDFLARHPNSPFLGRQFLEPQFLEEFLEQCSSLPEGAWEIFVGPECVAILARNGFTPEIIIQE